MIERENFGLRWRPLGEGGATEENDGSLLVLANDLQSHWQAAADRVRS
jgi:hypothetical protein